MVRTKDDTPAVCNVCNTDFSSAGPLRYRNLKRHMENVHPNHGGNSQCGDGNMLLSAGRDNNINIHLHINSITASDYTALLEGLNKIISDCIRDKKKMIPEMMHVLHTSNENVVIPNKNKDEILLKTGDHMVETLPIAHGVNICVDAFIKDGIPKVEEKLDEIGVNPETSKCRERMEYESKIHVDVGNEFKKKLVNDNPQRRRKITKTLQTEDY